MASEIDGYGQTGDVRRVDLDVDAERGDASAEPLRPDAEIVDAFEQLAFEAAEIGARMAHVDRPQDRLLCEERRRFKRPADADADNDRRTGVRARAIDGLEDEVGDRGHAIGRDEHLQRAHVLRAESFGCERDLHVAAGNDLGMNDRRRIAARHLEFSGADLVRSASQRIAGD